ncbi:hypothetical protein RJ640_008189 [Escallonia rubra]|uniref:Uncharacterized protein n=1 Tax=Escallonia rubra TaxID=112253 RepID=A0AA88U771_9ASTE|nr:hypothetical protein RJ640_008189 [Escallonia rubra]
MAISISALKTPPFFKHCFPSRCLLPPSNPTPKFRCFAAKQQRPPPPSTTNKKRRKKTTNSNSSTKGFRLDDVEFEDDVGNSDASTSLALQPPLPLPKPPAGFVVDDQGRVDSTNNFQLECIIRRVFRSSQGDECMLLCPVDTPIQILKSKNFDGWSAVSDEEIEAILPTAAYALAKIHMHLVYSGFCYTARGGFCYTEDNIFEFFSDDGQDVDGLPIEGVEITCFNLNYNLTKFNLQQSYLNTASN